MCTVSIISIFISFVLGLLTGILIEMLRFRFLIRKDNWNELKPYLSEVYTDLRDIQNKTQYLVNSGSLKDETAKRFLNDIVNRLKRYSTWFETLQSKTLTQKLRSVDEELSAHLHRLHEFSRNALNSKNYLMTRLRVLLEIVDVVIEEINDFMRGEILSFSLKRRKLRRFEEVW